eukprot:CAMPEP_0174268150 /NCGR_PEP_ID=MMETSP0439-20130205/36352_1 /TAXON_ID=0 /ORGANISM="Stereomyxa ramosa, Strain Chinc5" /LENGTH=415 /DNA_ID=CAMNT_0015356141 /DNA_START=125 /DNA_END=1372 /DNA_ORIENTATION=+
MTSSKSIILSDSVSPGLKRSRSAWGRPIDANPAQKKRCKCLPVEDAPFQKHEITTCETQNSNEYNFFIYAPSELLFHLCSFLEGKDLCMLKSSCKRFYAVVKDPTIWRELCFRTFDRIYNRFASFFGKSWEWIYRAKSVTFFDKNNIVGEKVGCVIENGIRWEGTWKGSSFSGYGLAHCFEAGGLWDEGVICEGHWQDGKLMGFGRESFSDGEYYEGVWKNNVLEGRGVHSKANGRFYKGEFHQSSYHGSGLMVYPDRSKYIGRFRFGEKHGRGALVFPDKTMYVGNWVNDKRSGLGQVRLPNGLAFRALWKEGQPFPPHTLPTPIRTTTANPLSTPPSGASSPTCSYSAGCVPSANRGVAGTTVCSGFGISVQYPDCDNHEGGLLPVSRASVDSISLSYCFQPTPVTILSSMFS